MLCATLPNFDLVRRSLATGQLTTQRPTAAAVVKAGELTVETKDEVTEDEAQLAWVQAGAEQEHPADRRILSPRRFASTRRLTQRDRARTAPTDDTKWWLPPEGTTTSFLRRGHGDTTRAKLLDANTIRVTVNTKLKVENVQNTDSSDGGSDSGEQQEEVKACGKPKVAKKQAIVQAADEEEEDDDEDDEEEDEERDDEEQEDGEEAAQGNEEETVEDAEKDTEENAEGDEVEGGAEEIGDGGEVEKGGEEMEQETEDDGE